MKPSKKVVISDLDNTLFDWFDIWYGGFRAMLDMLVESTGVPEELLLPEIKKIHEKHGTSEYLLVAEELPIVCNKFHGDEFLRISRLARQRFEEGRTRAMKLYPTVEETLSYIKKQGCLIVGYTESMGIYSNYRLHKLGLDCLLDSVYSPPDHQLPKSPSSIDIDLYTNHEERLRVTKLRHTPTGELKPNARILLEITRELNVSLSDCIYIGDSLMKDIAMAQDAGVDDVWAEFGVVHEKAEYELLRAVTHWSFAAVEKEKNLSRRHIFPTYVLHRTLSELKDLFTFVPFNIEKNQAVNDHPCCLT